MQDWCDAIGFLAPDLHVKEDDAGFGKKRARADGGSQRWLHWEARPAFTAKNRYGLPAKMPIDKDFSYGRSPSYFPAAAGASDGNPQPTRLTLCRTQLPETFDPKTRKEIPGNFCPLANTPRRSSRAGAMQPKNGDGYYVALTWKICEGDYEGRQVWQRITFLHAPNRRRPSAARPSRI